MRPVVLPPVTADARRPWRRALEQWRRSAREVAAFVDHAYEDPSLEWVTHCFSLFF